MFSQKSPHPAFSHLLPEGEGKEPTGCFLLKRSNLQVKSMTQNPRPFWERGDHRRWWVRDCFEWKSEENEQFEVAPHPAFSHLLPEGEGKETEQIFSCQVTYFHQ